MPTVLRKNGFQVVIWTNDHEPMHVHIFRAESEIPVNLSDISIIDNFEMNNRNARTALQIVEENQEFLQTSRREIHG